MSTSSDSKEDISQLTGSDGARPSSNVDAYKLHSFYSNLPIYRKKYDWNVPKWTPEELTLLHKLVKSQVVAVLSAQIEEKYGVLPYCDSQRLLQILELLTPTELYIVYLNFDFAVLAVLLVELVRGDFFVPFLETLNGSSSACLYCTDRSCSFCIMRSISSGSGLRGSSSSSTRGARLGASTNSSHSTSSSSASSIGVGPTNISAATTTGATNGNGASSANSASNSNANTQPAPITKINQLPNRSNFYKMTSYSFNAFREIYRPNKPRFQGVDLSLFWDCVAEQLNATHKGNLASKIATDCCIKFIHSTSDGVLLEDLSDADFAKIEKFISTNYPHVESSIDDALSLGVTPYQYTKALLHQDSTSKWEPSEDAILMELAANNELDPTTGQNLADSKYHVDIYCEEFDIHTNSTSSPIREDSTSCNSSVSWKDISRKIPGKSPEQCRLRFRQINKNKISDSPFVPKEMAKLRILKAVYGNNWSKIADMMPGRSSRQCRDKIAENIKFTMDNAMESLSYLRNFLTTFEDYYSGANKPFFISRYWKNFDWLGQYLIIVLKITRNPDLLEVLRSFYFSTALENRIRSVFCSNDLCYIENEFDPFKKLQRPSYRIGMSCTGSDIYGITNFLQIIASAGDEVNFEKVTRLNRAVSKQLFKRCGSAQKYDFENFDKNDDFEHLKGLVLDALNRVWP